MKTKHLISLLVAVAIGAAATGYAFGSCNSTTSTAEKSSSSKTITKTFDLSGFDEIEACGQYNITVKKGASHSVVATLPSNKAEYLNFYVKDHELYLDYKRKLMGKNIDLSNVKIVVTMPSLREIDLSGQTSLTIAGAFSYNKLNVDASGQSTVTLGNVNATELEVEVSGQSTIKGGTVKVTKLEASASGQSSISFANLTADRAKAEASGMSTIKATKSSIGNLDRSTSGMSTISL